jgi:hypothetical protein
MNEFFFKKKSTSMHPDLLFCLITPFPTLCYVYIYMSDIV